MVKTSKEVRKELKKKFKNINKNRRYVPLAKNFYIPTIAEIKKRLNGVNLSGYQNTGFEYWDCEEVAEKIMVDLKIMRKKDCEILKSNYNYAIEVVAGYKQTLNGKEPHAFLAVVVETGVILIDEKRIIENDDCDVFYIK